MTSGGPTAGGLVRAAYVLAMRLMQSPLWDGLDDEERAAATLAIHTAQESVCDRGGPRGTPPPLDLAAVAARLRLDDPFPDAFKHSKIGQEMWALLAHARALRAALKKHGSHSRGCPARFTGIGEWYARPECTCGVAAVLAQATDGPT